MNVKETSEREDPLDPAREKPSNYALLSVLAVMSFFPLGFVSQYYAFQVDRLYYQRSYDLASKASKKALIYANISIILGFIVTILILLALVWVFTIIAEQFVSADLTNVIQGGIDSTSPGISEGGIVLDGDENLLDLLNPESNTENLDTIEQLLEQLDSSSN